MIIKVPHGNGECFDFDTDNLPLGARFDRLLETLRSSDVQLMVHYAIAHGYKKHPKLAMKIIEQVIEKGMDTGRTSLLMLLACKLQAGADGIDVVQRIGGLESTTFDILKGFASLKRKSYDAALFLFRKAGFQLGVEICNYYTGNYLEAKKSMNKVIRGYCIVKEARDVKEICKATVLLESEGIRNALYRLNASDEYDDETNTDVMIRQAEELVEKGDFVKAKDLIDRIPRNAESLYLRGKIEHISGSTENAKRWYMESLECDKLFIKSEYNLQRILQQKMRDVSYPSKEFSDFKVYMQIKNGVNDVNLNGCSDEFRDVISAVLGGRRKTDVGLRRYMKLIGNCWIENFVVMNNIGYFMCRGIRPFDRHKENEEDGSDKFLVGSIGENCSTEQEGLVSEGVKYLEMALDVCPDQYREAIKYNIGYATEDKQMLRECTIKEAELVLSVAGDGIEHASEELELMGYHHMQRKEFKLAKKILQRMDTVYSSIALGNMCIRSFIKDNNESALENAMDAFSKGLRSYYCGNGVGICLALSGRYEEAAQIFREVVVDWKGGYVNLGNIMVCMKRYKEAMEAFLNVSSMRYSRRMLGMLCRVVDTIESYMACMNEGLSDIKGRLFELLVLEERLEEAEQLDVDDAELLNMYNRKKEEVKERGMDLKRKRNEINEYRKRRNASYNKE
ncbi:hypothetical protein CWI42_070250 [Ordospora colligata]|uniref:Uncharacterized protein n=1 Tax=Ordospora colligata OC4 TaxID=1354746 RepID=A0A0B2UJN3_9MICR|nr:uncharacterized protein M896_070250 [Ordospora colligata OC4]KHN69459.1 hypothetical protein M896_070250 [Ordospora colligata OC4]TBU15203.1 hypothetical protein CWI41_070250 [Ordospora colligata]TBU15274.1 hypothetical protein CWI40_070250 [Ordospora colligata]TBU18456.1 hypothetical protein CWI42_070250 [Ordospora colligata]